uniref:CD209 antigen-like protein E isoform X2 n=1 Tax=Monopterus albus TaxID=43700 RepID=UPI0009B30469|nr:CD209 antigen-like protein E isoform X2 [Monopterus albus]
MEEIHDNVGYDESVQAKPSRNQTGPRSSQRRFHAAVVCLGLLSVFQLVGLIGLAVHSAELSTVKDNLTNSLQASNSEVLSLTEEKHLLNASLIETAKKRNRLNAELSTVRANLTEERDRLQARLTEMTEERDRLLSLSKQKKTCPTGWRMFSSSCYFFSTDSGSWDRGREDCRARGGDLVVIDCREEQTFLSGFIRTNTWIGLNDRGEENKWKWIDGTPLTLMSWARNQPDNGGGDPQWGEEDCVHIYEEDNTSWNDRSCTTSLQWICEKTP